MTTYEYFETEILITSIKQLDEILDSHQVAGCAISEDNGKFYSHIFIRHQFGDKKLLLGTGNPEVADYFMYRIIAHIKSYLTSEE